MRGDNVATICQITRFDSWFVTQMAEIADFERNLTALDEHSLRQAKRLGFTRC
ncbi:MAG: hypothetical protein R2932_13660 [Caldilineaceae bacterium]